jgi:hypothetical protein
MTLFKAVVASSAVALTILSQAVIPVSALATPHVHGLSARHASPGVSPNHGGIIKRKRNLHKQRKRCLAQTNPGTPSSSSSSAVSTPTNSGNSNGNTGGSGGGSQVSSWVCSNTNTKFAIAMEWMLADNLAAFRGNACGVYNWAAYQPDPNQLGNLQYWPMLARGDWTNVNEFQNNVLRSGTTYKWVLGFNEVNQRGQAAGDGDYMDIGWARQLWYDNFVPLRSRGTGLVSPSITNTDGGLDWLSNWMNTLGDDAKPDAMAVHWYGTTPDDLRNWLEKVHNRFGKPIWLTEFACNDFGTQSCPMDVFAFAAQAKAILNSLDYVVVAAPFGFVNTLSGVNPASRLISDDGWPNDLARMYLSY